MNKVVAFEEYSTKEAVNILAFTPINKKQFKRNLKILSPKAESDSKGTWKKFKKKRKERVTEGIKRGDLVSLWALMEPKLDELKKEEKKEIKEKKETISSPRLTRNRKQKSKKKLKKYLPLVY